MYHTTAIHYVKHCFDCCLLACCKKPTVTVASSRSEAIFIWLDMKCFIILNEKYIKDLIITLLGLQVSDPKVIDTGETG